MSKILVTGGAGFIGSHLVDQLIKLDHDVTIIDNLSTGNRNNINSKAKFYNIDICNNLDEIFDAGQFGYVFHLAAHINLRKSFSSPYMDAQNNIMGSLNLIENCVRYEAKIIFSSTGGAIYNKGESLPWNEEDEAKPESPYGLSKLTIENYLRIYKNYGLESTVLRYSNVYGPRQDARGEAGVISIFISNALKNEPICIFGNGEQTRDFVYVDDVVGANIHCMDNKVLGAFNVSTEMATSVNDIAELIIRSTESKSSIEHLSPVAGEILHTCLSSNKLKKTGWIPRMNLLSGMNETIKFERRYE